MPDNGMSSFSTFGDLLKYLRRRAQLTQRELAVAVGYTEGHVSRLEKNLRPPDLATVAALFVPALGLEEEPETAAQLLRFAASAHGDHLPMGENLTVSRVQETTEISRRVESIPSNLPIQLTTFIGRQREISELTTLLSRANPARLVTLTGPGGIGKTRLALQTAIGLSNLYLDGIWFIDLAPLYTPELVIQTIASALRVTEAGTQSIEETLISYLRSKQILLVIDNCEHLIDAVAQSAEKLLRASARVQILATSREPLNIPGEVNFQVSPLSLPESQDSASQTVMGHESVQLFIERARSVQPAFALTDANAGTIAHICRQLDGMPLAIELATARLTLLDLQQIASRLSDRFQLLTSGSRTALPRHKTLRAMIDWSYDLLSEQEKVLFCRLSVFAGGWTLEAAERVASDDVTAQRAQDETIMTHPLSIAIARTLDLLSHLVGKSLVVVDHQPGAGVRYRMLETVRQYATEKLIESGEQELIRNRHLNFFLALAEQAEPELRGGQQLVWLSQLDEAHDNLRTALAWSLEQKNAEAALRLVGALFEFWHIRGYTWEGRRWIGDALTAQGNIDALLSSSWRAKALLGNGVLMYFQGDYGEAQTNLETSQRIYRNLSNPFGEGYALYILGAIAFRQSNYPLARLHYEESLAIREAARDAWGVGNCLYGLGYVAMLEGNFEASRSCFEKSVTILREAGDQWSLAQPLDWLAWEVWFQGDVTKARSLLQESLSVRRRLLSKSGVATTLGSMAVMATVHGDYMTARLLEEEALSMAREVGNKFYMAYSFQHLGDLAYHQSDLTQARMHFTESMRLFREMNEKASMGLLLRDLGRVAYQEGDYQQAANLLEESKVVLQRSGNEHMLNYTLLALGELARLQGEDEQAVAYYRQSLKLHRERGVVIEVADRLEGLAKIAGAQRQPEKAGRLFGAAQTLREQLDTPLPPIERADYDLNLGAVRAALGEEVFSTAWAEGQAMLIQSLERVVEYAMDSKG
jgi:predicted ATPase/transcriptional regulator with XRE-family HTH domain